MLIDWRYDIRFCSFTLPSSYRPYAQYISIFIWLEVLSIVGNRECYCFVRNIHFWQWHRAAVLVCDNISSNFLLLFYRSLNSIAFDDYEEAERATEEPYAHWLLLNFGRWRSRYLRIDRTVCHALEVKESSLRKLPITQMSRGRQRWQALVLISIRYLNLLAIKRQLQLLLPERVKNKGTQHTGRSAQCNNIDAPLQPFVFYL